MGSVHCAIEAAPSPTPTSMPSPTPTATPSPAPDVSPSPDDPTIPPEGSPTPLPDTAKKFDDVDPTAYYAKAVDWAVKKNVTSGISETKFGPGKPCTRGQIVTFLWRAAGSPEAKVSSNQFADIKPGDYFYKAVLWAVEQKITSGTDELHFSPNAPCTRAQAITFIWRTEGKPEPERKAHFSDVAPKSYYASAVDWGVE